MKRNENARSAICPICGKAYRGVPATSRTDNTTPICPDCGIRQALEGIGVKPDEQDTILEIIHRYTETPANVR